MIGVIVKSGPYSSSRVKEGLRACVSLALDQDVEVLLIGDGERCLDAEDDDWAVELNEHIETLEEFGTLSVGHGGLERVLEEAERVITI